MFYTSTVAPSGELCIDTSIYGEGDTIYDTVLHADICPVCGDGNVNLDL